MSGTEVVGACDTMNPPCHRPRHGLEGILGAAAWERLPRAVRARFGEPVLAVDYVGEFEIVRASLLGRLLAWLCQLIGTPVVPRTGRHVPAIVRVGPTEEGVAWNREYRWPDSTRCLVRSTKVIGPDGTLVEKLPAQLCMPLDVFERGGALHFVSRGYYFELGAPRFPGRALPIRIPLPAWLSPGTTHVEHRDESHGWFRFTLTVRHRFFGELFYQTGRFRAAGG
ncbi:MAG TPA: DUF4166 domain-containing protein [Steroidobacteraceae bacterium]|nr:DUF4166 domain-containing protein [Steroidobacteraceae bacterium]